LKKSIVLTLCSEVRSSSSYFNRNMSDLSKLCFWWIMIYKTPHRSFLIPCNKIYRYSEKVLILHNIYYFIPHLWFFYFIYITDVRYTCEISRADISYALLIYNWKLKQCDGFCTVNSYEIIHWSTYRYFTSYYGYSDVRRPSIQ